MYISGLRRLDYLKKRYRRSPSSLTEYERHELKALAHIFDRDYEKQLDKKTDK